MDHGLKIHAALLLYFAALALCGASQPETIVWRGHTLREIRSLAQLPKSIQDRLGVGRFGMDGIADRDGNFNVTDLVDANLPMRRFAVAGISDDAVLIAIERGGIGYSVEVFLFENIKRAIAEKITSLFRAPKSLEELVKRIDGCTVSDNWLLNGCFTPLPSSPSGSSPEQIPQR